MIFTDSQIEEILGLIDYQTAFLVGANMGTDMLSREERAILNKFDVSVEKLYQKFPPAVKSFFFGRLTAMLSEYQSKQIDYNDFIKFLNKGQYVPLSPRENAELKAIRKMSTSHIRSLGNRMKTSVEGIIFEEDSAYRNEREKVLRDELKQGVLDKRSLTNIVNEIGKKTGDWTKDWGRIVDTEMNNIYQQGRAQTIIDTSSIEAKVYKMPFPDACRHCIRLYLTSGVGSKPRVFTLEELVANGTNVGRKVRDWKAVLGSMHPHCRCHLVHVLPGQVWDEEKQMFDFPKKIENKVKRKSKIKVTVGDKVFNV